MSEKVATQLTSVVQTYQAQLEEAGRSLETARARAMALEATVRELETRLLKASEELTLLRGFQKEPEEKDTGDKQYWVDFRSSWGDLLATACSKAYTRLRQESSCIDISWPAPALAHGALCLTMPFIIWAPRRQGQACLKCPECQGTLSPSKLSEPRKIFGTTGPLLYLTEIYQCSKNGCRKTVMGDSDCVLAQLSKYLAHSLPLQKTQKFGITHDLADIILATASTAMSVSELHASITEVYAMRYHRIVTAFYARKLDSKLDHETKLKGFSGFKWNPQAESFPLPAPPNDWLPPSLDFFEDVQLSLLQARRSFYDAYMQKLGGTVLSCDHTFKLAQCLWSKQERPFRSIFSVFNEYGEIVSSVYTRNENFDTLSKCLAALAARPSMHVHVVYVDNCCTVRQKIGEFFPNAVVLLDLWHFLQRLWRAVKASSGTRCETFRAFMADVRQALVEPLSITLQTKGSLKAWEKKIPGPIELTKRMTLLQQKHAGVLEAHPKLKSQWSNCMEHIERGCLSDPAEICLVREDKYGKRRCCRGTNVSESHHSRNRAKCLLRGKNSCVVSDAIVACHCYRTNVRQGVRFRGILDIRATDPLMMSRLRLLVDAVLEGCILTVPNPYENLPLSFVKASEEFFSDYTHPILVAPPALSLPQRNVVVQKISHVIGGFPPQNLPGPIAMSDFNFTLSGACLFLDFVPIGCSAIVEKSLAHTLDEIERHVDEVDEDDDVDESESTSLLVRCHLAIAERYKLPLHEVVEKCSLYQILYHAVQCLNVPLVCAHFKSSDYFVLTPENSATFNTDECHLIVIVGPNQFAWSLLPLAELEHASVQSGPPSIHSADTPRQVYTIPCNLVPSAHVAAPQRGDEVQRNIITMAITKEEFTLLLTLVRQWWDKNKTKKNIDWDAVRVLYDNSVQKQESSEKKAAALRYSRDAVQLRSAYNNRAVNKAAAAEVKEFEDWKFLFIDSLQSTTSRRISKSGQSLPPTSTPASDPPAVDATSASLPPAPVISPPKRPRDSSCATTFSLSSTLQPSPDPPRQMSRLESTHGASSSASSLSGLPEQFVTPQGDTDWVAIQRNHPDIVLPEDHALDRSRAITSRHWWHQVANRDDELLSLRGGQCILHPILMRCLLALAPPTTFVVPYEVAQGPSSPLVVLRDEKDNPLRAEDKTILFLLFFKHHYISAAARTTGQKMTLFWWDSLKNYFKDHRQEVIDGILCLLRRSFPTLAVGEKKLPCAEQAQASNDCGLHSLQNLFDFLGMKTEVTREMLKNYVAEQA